MLFNLGRHFLSEDFVGLENEESRRQEDLHFRLKRTLYFGEGESCKGATKPLQDFAVDYFCQSAPRELGRLDSELAAEISSCRSVSACSLMLGLVFIERMRQRNPEYLQRITSSDLFLVSMLVAAKYAHDDGTTEESYNDDWAEHLSRDTKELNTLERNFLAAIDWELYVAPEKLTAVMRRVQNCCARTQAASRGYSCTYTELELLLSDSRFVELCTRCLNEAVRLLAGLGVAVLLCSAVLLGAQLSAYRLLVATRSLHAAHLTHTTHHGSLVDIASGRTEPQDQQTQLASDLSPPLSYDGLLRPLHGVLSSKSRQDTPCSLQSTQSLDSLRNPDAQTPTIALNWTFASDNESLSLLKPASSWRDLPGLLSFSTRA